MVKQTSKKLFITTVTYYTSINLHLSISIKHLINMINDCALFLGIII